MKIFKRMLWTFGIASMPFLLSAHRAGAEELTMGWEDWQPYQYRDSNQVVTGLDVELTQAIFKNMNYTIALVELPWKRHLQNIEAGRTDVAASASKTSEREQYAFFSDPYRTESAVMYIRKEDAGKYQFDSLKGIIGTDFTLAVTRGYYYGEEFAELSKDPAFKKHIREVNDNQLAQRQLVKKRVDGFLEDPIAASIELRDEGVLDKVMVHMPIYSDDIYLMLSRKSTTPEIVTEVNKSLAEIRSNGTYDRIMSKYLQ